MNATEKIFAANWKLNKDPEEARSFLKSFRNLLAQQPLESNREVIIFPTAMSLATVSEECKNTKIHFGPQNVYYEKSGAFTGENSATMAQKLGSTFCLIGHSERRQIFHESDAILHRKVELLQSLKMTPVLCIGETQKQRDEKKTLLVCFQQLDEALVDVDHTQRLIIAYEPVWAIGTGLVATLDQVAEVHSAIHDKLSSRNFKNFQILYGGSVKPDNASDLLKVPHVDGFLIGGASLEPDSFMKICQAEYKPARH